MTFFGVGFRILLVALAVLIERVGELLRGLQVDDLTRHPAVAKLLARARTAAEDRPETRPR